MKSFLQFVTETGLWDNIHAKRERIAGGSGEKMRKPGSKGAPTKQNLVDAQESAAWTRKEGKNPAGGLNAKGRASYKGGTLKAPVKAGDNPRRASFLARMGGMPGPERKPDGSPTRLLLSLNAWGASSKADAKRKAAAISKRNKGAK